MEDKKPAQKQPTGVEANQPQAYQKPLIRKVKLPKAAIAAIVALVVLLISIPTIYLLVNNKASKEATQDAQQPSAAEVSWQSYTNSKYNYSVSYPDNWSVSQYQDASGASFSKSGEAGENVISISVGQKIGNYIDYTLESYVKVAGDEIQNYGDMVSMKKITTDSGQSGYEATFMVQSFGNSKASESLPITYFEIPNNKNLLLRVILNEKSELATYEKMLKTVKITTPSRPSPTVDEKITLQTVIKKYIALKHNSKEESFTITVSKIEGNFAQGGVSDQEGGGGMWFAAKQDGVWKLVWDGNGIIECSDLDLYPDFPSSMIPGCYDTAKQDTVTR